MTHCVKTWPEFFIMQESGQKPWELRKNDRNYQPGDTFISQEWDPVKKSYTGKETTYTIEYMLVDFAGLKPGYCILTFKAKETN